MILPSLLFLAAILSHIAASSVQLEPRTARPGVWPSQHYITENFTAPDMAVFQDGDTASGYLFLTPSGNGTDVNAPVIMTQDNKLVWRGPAGGYIYNNFRVQKLHGLEVLTSWYGKSSATYTHGYGSIAIWDKSYNELYQICPSGLDIVAESHATYDCYLDMHESYLTNQGTIIASAYNVTQQDLTSEGGTANGWILDSMFYEIDVISQEVLFRWRSLDHLPSIPLNESYYALKLFGPTSATTAALPWDYFHINSVQPLSDGYLVNSRHFYSMYKVSKATGNVEWQLSGLDGGDFTLDPDVYFSWQHMPRASDVTNSSMRITLFNNDNSEGQAVQTNDSTGLSLFVNFKTMHVSLDRKLQDTSEMIVSSSQGSFQSLERHHALVGYGSVATTREFDAKGKIVYEAKYGYSNATSFVASYRSYKQEWAAQPAAAPKLAATCMENNATLYMSWNGATTYTDWTVYAGNTSDSLVYVATVAKSGFETAYDMTGGSQFAKVVAIAEGTALSNSTTVGIPC